jgi:seryl-tRNA synthetase
MVDIQFIREHSEEVKEKTKQKGYDVDIDELLRIDAERLELLQQVETLRMQRNENATAIKTAGGKPDQALIDNGKQIKVELADREALLTDATSQWERLYKKVPNMPLADVPVGASEDENVVAKEWGEAPHFDFEPKSHVALAAAKDWIDKERAAKVTGSRFAYIKGDLVHLQFAIISYVFATLSNKEIIQKLIDENNLAIANKAFTPILPPLMIREEIYDQMDRLEPREDRYHIDGDDDNLWLIGSAEHTLGSMYAGEILPVDALPIRYVGYSSSFRQEAGTYGKDTEGIIRMHQFDKLEMETFSSAETGLDEHKLLIAIQEFMMQQLGIPYRVIQKCTADIGKPNARGVDIDAWMPGQNAYRETHTADYMTDYQSRRLQTRTKTPDGIISLVHTNDATAFALGRTLIAIVENYQTKEGDVRVPDVLKPYVNGRELI